MQLRHTIADNKPIAETRVLQSVDISRSLELTQQSSSYLVDIPINPGPRFLYPFGYQG